MTARVTGVVTHPVQLQSSGYQDTNERLFVLEPHDYANAITAVTVTSFDMSSNLVWAGSAMHWRPSTVQNQEPRRSGMPDLSE